MEKNYQTIIIGAGPAGLIAGQYLEDALILDKKKEIGRPVQCGEGIGKKAFEFQKIKPNSGWVCCRVHRIERIMPNRKTIGGFHREVVGYVIDRPKFEKFLAKKLKAELKLNAKVIDVKKEKDFWRVTTSNNKIFQSKYLIGADGPHSIVRRKIFPENQKKMRFIPAIEYLIKLEKKLDTKTMQVYLDNEKYPRGYAWIFPKSKNTANIGIGCIRKNLIKEFKDFLKEIVKKRYGRCQLIENRSGVIPLRTEELNFFKDNALLVGDAGGLTDPIFKGGINQAMLSGKIAAECILENKASQYEEKIRALPFTNKKILKASETLYSFNNQILNELGELLEGKGTSYLKDISNPTDIFIKSHLRKNFPKILEFFSIWWKNRDYLR